MNEQREQTIELVRKRMLARGNPRLLMTVFLSLTGLSGFLVSFVLLHAGITKMMLRYPLAIIAAYCVFLLLLRFWLYLHARRQRDDDLSELNIVDGLDPLPNVSGETFDFSGAGNSDAAGAGAGDSWVNSATNSSMNSHIGSVSSSSTSSGGDWFDLNLDELIWLVLAVLAICGALVASLYVVFIAPALFAEILVDGLLVTTLYKRMKNVEQRNWLRSAFAKTWLPLTFVLLFFIIAGYLLQRAAPDANSLGGVWTSVTKSER